MTGPARRRAGRVHSPSLQVLADLLRHASLRRSWLPLLIVVFAVVAAALVLFSQTVVPWAIYPAL